MTTEATAQQAKTGTDLATLEKTVNLPRHPQAVQWRKSLLGSVGLGPTDWQFLAVLDYSEADARALQAELKPSGNAPEVPKDGGWLPAPTREALKGAKVYDASAFYKGSLRSGALYQLPGSNTFVLALFTM
jgi:hypothetical protein